ncbi:hypothetical protein ARMGADRAFT_1037916 [Armillaria gallica]|uniref:Uncharacterized protein n=1 Tax=Armillaria gallica TaxID=47427 RepID=A0A2H3CYI7_ARMGA|nr:hypothetical protein ARMGADRAFT_1037916 [Armillaria gallica]
MIIQTNIPPNLPYANSAAIFEYLNAELNSLIFYSLLHGIYTGIIAVTLGNIPKAVDKVMNKSWSIRHTMIAILILLYMLTTVNFALHWSEISSTFINNGQSIWTRYIFYASSRRVIILLGGTASAICTILADSTMLYIVQTIDLALLDSLGTEMANHSSSSAFSDFCHCLLKLSLVFRIIAVCKLYADSFEVYFGFLLYSSFMIATTLWCTLLIIYRIISVALAGNEAGDGVRTYRYAIEILVESSALFSMALILYIAFYAHDDYVFQYFDILAAITRGIAPTLLVGRVAAGHARPDDSWQGSVISGSLRFGTHSGSQNSQQDSIMSSDLEAQAAQQDIDNEYGHHTIMVNSQENLANEGFVHEDDPEILQARVDNGGGVNSENAVYGDDLEAQLNELEDSPIAVLIIQRD